MTEATFQIARQTGGYGLFARVTVALEEGPAAVTLAPALQGCPWAAAAIAGARVGLAALPASRAVTITDIIGTYADTTAAVAAAAALCAVRAAASLPAPAAPAPAPPGRAPARAPHPRAAQPANKHGLNSIQAIIEPGQNWVTPTPTTSRSAGDTIESGVGRTIAYGKEGR